MNAGYNFLAFWTHLKGIAFFGFEFFETFETPFLHILQVLTPDIFDLEKDAKAHQHQKWNYKPSE